MRVSYPNVFKQYISFSSLVWMEVGTRCFMATFSELSFFRVAKYTELKVPELRRKTAIISAPLPTPGGMCSGGTPGGMCSGSTRV